MTAWPAPIRFGLVFAAATLPATFTLSPTFDHDTWWHLRVGQSIVETGSVPQYDTFSRLGQDTPTPWLAYSWLYEWGLYQAWTQLGDPAIPLIRTLLVFLSTATVLNLIVRTGQRRELALALVAVLCLMPLARERPWHLTILFTGITAWVVDEIRSGVAVTRFVWLPLLFVVWANVHIQFVFGGLFLGLACLWPGTASRAKLVRLTLACLLATWINPYHVRLVGVIWDYATQTVALREVQELAPPDWTRPWIWAGLGLWVWAAYQTAIRRPRDGFAVVLLLVTLVLMLRMRRDIWLAPVAAGLVMRSAVDESDPNRLSWRGVVLAVVVAFGGVRLANLSGFGPSPDSSAANRQVFPVGAVEYLKANPHPGPLYNPFDWGGYLIWALPEHPVSIDGRTNLYGSDRLSRAFRTLNAEPGWDHDPDLRAARIVIVSIRSALSARLREQPDQWVLILEQEPAMVFVRVDP